MVQIIFTLDGATQDLLTLDAALSIDEQHQAQVTDHPIETGAVVTDHVILRPTNWKLEGIVTATPVVAGGPAPFSDALITIDGDQAGTIPWDTQRYRDAADTLRAIHAARQPCMLAQDQDVVESLIMETLDIPKDGTTGEALRFTATFKSASFVSSATVALPKASKSGAVNRGRQGTTVVDPPKGAPDSLLKSVFSPSP